jgi:hypothetical protein
VCVCVHCTGIRFPLPGPKPRKSYCDLGRKYLIGDKRVTGYADGPEARAAREWLTGSFEFDITELEAFVVRK